MTHEELAERIKADINDAEARLTAANEGDALELVQKAHKLLNRAHCKLRDKDTIQPFSSGDKDPDTGD